MRFRYPGQVIAITLRARILLAFLSLTAMTGCLGFSAIHGAMESGRLLARMFDGPLSAVGQASEAEADFAAMRLALAGQGSAATSAVRQQTDTRLNALAQQVDDALSALRGGSGAAALLAQPVQAEFHAWNRQRLQGESGIVMVAGDTAVTGEADTLLHRLDRLRRAAAADGRQDRADAVASIRRDRVWAVAATVAALLLGTAIALLLAHEMVKPIAAASRAARRIAAGELDVEIATAGHDELGSLLSAMTAMRDNIRDMVERERGAYRSAQGRLTNAIQGLQEGIALIGSDGRLILANAQFAAFFPQHAAALVEGARLPPEAEAALGSPTGETRVRDGRWLRLSRSDRVDGGCVLIASDITLLKEREAALHAAKEQAEAANRAKTEFITNMSHELRTPLTAIIGFSEIIANEAFGPVGQAKYREFADDILHSGRHLLDVINDMLDIAKLQSGMTELRLQHVPSRAIVDGAVRIVRKKAEQAGVALELMLPPDMPMVHVDHLRMRQVLLNLLSNAIKFTPAAGKVSVIAERRDAGLAITVRDTGIGMAPEDIPRALQPFVQVDNSLARRHGGTGLGLPLSKLFIDLHGGQLTIRSAPGKGTSVTILLPTPAAAGAASVRAELEDALGQRAA